MSKYMFPEQDQILEAESRVEDEMTEDFLELNKAQFFHGSRQILRDPLARLLNTGSFMANVGKPWGRDYRGGVMDIYFAREYPACKVMVDDVAEDFKDDYFQERRELCAKYGYVYLYSCPRQLLDAEEFDKQMKLAAQALRVAAQRFLPSRPPVAEDVNEEDLAPTETADGSTNTSHHNQQHQGKKRR